MIVFIAFRDWGDRGAGRGGMLVTSRCGPDGDTGYGFGIRVFGLLLRLVALLQDGPACFLAFSGSRDALGFGRDGVIFFRDEAIRITHCFEEDI